jgi:hypothetical protein
MKTTKRGAAAPGTPVPQPEPPAAGPSTGAAAAFYFGMALLYFLPAFLPGNHIYGTDYLVGGYFFHEFISARFAEGELPKWVPYVYGGLPLFANPGSTYYPFRFLADALFHTSRIWPTLFVIHFGLAGIGTYLLAREIGARRWVAFIAGIAFQFTGLTMSWVLAGHEGRIIVATFTPLVFFLFHRGIRTGALWPFVGAAAAIGFALLSFQIQVAYYLLLAAAIWSVFALVHFRVHREGRRLARTVSLGLGAVAFAFALASVNFLPFTQYVAESPRGEPRGWEYATSWSMPAAEITAIAVPEEVGFLEHYRGTNPMKLHMEYVGVVVLLLFAAGFVTDARRNRYWWFFAGLALFALTISLGGNTPIYRIYYELLPGTKRFRAAAIAFFLVSFSLVMMATIALESLAARRTAARDREPADVGRVPWVLWSVAGVLVLGMLVRLGGVEAADPAAGARAAGWARVGVFSLVAAGVLWWWLRGRLATTVAMLLLAAVTLVDLWMPARSFFDTVPPPDEMFAADDVVRFLQRQEQPSRVWTLPLPQGMVYRGADGNYLMRFGLQQVGGEHGNQLHRYNEYLGAGERVYVDWHNFLAELGVVDTEEGQALAFRSTPGFLEGANVRFIVSMVPLAHPQLREVHRGSALIYEHVDALPRAWVVSRARPVAAGGALAAMRNGYQPGREAFVEGLAAPMEGEGLTVDPVEIVRYTPDEIVLRANMAEPGVIVLADNYYPGWVARSGQEEIPVLRTNHAFRGIALGAGEHTVTLTFEPRDQFLGWWIFVAGMLLLASYAIGLLVGHWRDRRATGAAT